MITTKRKDISWLNISKLLVLLQLHYKLGALKIVDLMEKFGLLFVLFNAKFLST
jgi:hypothetical protein